MASSYAIRQRAVREQSAALAVVLSAAPGASGAQGGKLTGRGRAMLEALAAARNGATPAELIAAHPQLYGTVPVRSATSGLHLTGAHLVRQGYAKRGRRMNRSRSSGDVQGGPRLYCITETGRQVLG